MGTSFHEPRSCTVETWRVRLTNCIFVCCLRVSCSLIENSCRIFPPFLSLLPGGVSSSSMQQQHAATAAAAAAGECISHAEGVIFLALSLFKGSQIQVPTDLWFTLYNDHIYFYEELFLAKAQPNARKSRAYVNKSVHIIVNNYVPVNPLRFFLPFMLPCSAHPR
jgi:hypothetical protein